MSTLPEIVAAAWANSNEGEVRELLKKDNGALLGMLVLAARDCQRRGWFVFPCNSRDKRPAGYLVPHGFKDDGDEQRHARSGGTCDIRIAHSEDRLRPGASVRADPGRGAGAEAAGIDPVGDHVRDDRVEQGEEIGARVLCGRNGLLQMGTRRCIGRD